MFVHLTLMPHLGRRRRAEDETDAALRARAARDRDLARRDRRAHRLRAPIPVELKEKIALFCDVPPRAVVQNGDAPTIYRVPLNLEREGLAEVVDPQAAPRAEAARSSRSGRRSSSGSLHPRIACAIALVGKYVELKDAYISINEALYHAGIAHDAAVDDLAARLRDDRRRRASACLSGVDGILVAPGFGARGVKGKLRAIQLRARERSSRSSASASGCSWRASSSRATSAG